MLSFLLGFGSVLYIVICILLIIIVLMQESRGGGLASAFGGSGLDMAFGAGIGRKMSRFTVVLAVTFMVLSIILAVVKVPGTGAIIGGPPAPTRTLPKAPETPTPTEPAQEIPAPEKPAQEVPAPEKPAPEKPAPAEPSPTQPKGSPESGKEAPAEKEATPSEK